MDYWFRCPSCGQLASADDDQAHGRVSLDCPNDECSFHETGVIHPKIPTTEAVRRTAVFELRAVGSEGEQG